MEQKYNYFITCFEKLEHSPTIIVDCGAQRTFGYYDSFEMAKEAVEENRCDMWEFLYSYALIEKIGMGIHPDAFERWLFKYDRNKDGFFEIPQPIFMEGVCNFALG